MNLIRSLIGRRQFLIAAGATSTAALAYKKLAGVVDPGFHTSAAMAAEKSGKAENTGNYLDSSRFNHLMSPLRIWNVILKNRLFSTNG